METKPVMDKYKSEIEKKKTIDGLLSYFCDLFGFSMQSIEHIRKIEESIEEIRSASPESLLAAGDLSMLLKAYTGTVFTAEIDSYIKKNPYAKNILDTYELATDEEIKKELCSLGENLFAKEIKKINSLVKKEGEQFYELNLSDAHLGRKLSSIQSEREKLQFEYKTTNDIDKKIEISDRLEFLDFKYRMIKKQADEINEKVKNCEKERKECEKKIYEKVTNKLLEQSPISEKDAVKWARENVDIAEVKRRLKNIGYDENEFFQDIQMFYRLVGGKIGPVTFISTGSKERAFARGVSVIAVSKYFDKRTLFHEMGHLVEHLDGVIGQATKNFIKSRATGTAQSLAAMTGLKYEKDEVALPDNFINPYVGKVYQDKTTEVLSMGIECLSSPKKLIQLLRKDKQHFDLVVGACIKRSKALIEAQSYTHDKTKRKREIEIKWKENIKRVANEKLFSKLYVKNFHPLSTKEDEGYKQCLIADGSRRGSFMLCVYRENYGNWCYVPIKGRYSESKENCLKMAYICLYLTYVRNYSTVQDNAANYAGYVKYDMVPDWYGGEELPEV